MNDSKETELSIFEIILVICMFNFISYILISILIGGSASAGEIENGAYFIASRGDYKEVSEFTYRYSQLHGMSLFLTHPLAIFSIWVAAYRHYNKDNN